jgi:hypothetical protein
LFLLCIALQAPGAVLNFNMQPLQPTQQNPYASPYATAQPQSQQQQQQQAQQQLQHQPLLPLQRQPSADMQRLMRVQQAGQYPSGSIPFASGAGLSQQQATWVQPKGANGGGPGFRTRFRLKCRFTWMGIIAILQM